MTLPRLLDIGLHVDSLVALTQERASLQGDSVAYTFLQDGEAETSRLTYRDLDTAARAIAARLQELGLEGQRALLLYPASLEFLAAFLGCLYAGVVAVPAYPPRANKHLGRLLALVRDAQGTVVLTTRELLPQLERDAKGTPELMSLPWVATDALELERAATWRRPRVGRETLAFLQYTSGSTGSPKGVMVTHGNLLHNLEFMKRSFGHDEQTLMVSWLPLFHDMGLILVALEALYLGRPCIQMPPQAFLQAPLRWVRTVARYRGTCSGAPNFAYDLCLEKSTPEQRAELDLSCWKVAFNAAEPVRAKTIERFSKAFAPSGFRRAAFYPCYGMAEATVFMSGGDRNEPPAIQYVDKAALDAHRVVEASPGAPGAVPIVSCGRAGLDETIVIVDPETRRPCPPDRVGEVWATSPSVAQGYWQRPEETERTFRARLEGSTEGPFLRTGDLAFMRNGELFITGRHKEIVIIRGRNHYPQDLERTVEESHPALRPGCSAAFSVEVDGEERLVMVQEVKRDYALPINVEEVAKAARAAVIEEHDVPLHALVLIKAVTIPKTSSGKIQRRATKAAFLDGSLEQVGIWREPAPESTRPAEPAASNAASEERLRTWLVERMAARLRVPAREVDVRAPFSSFGLDSAAAVALSGDLQALLGRSLPAAIVYDYPSIQALAAHLAATPGAEFRALEPTRATAADEPVAIIGLACRVPGASDPEAFWRLLHDGVGAITEVPASRWDAASLYHPPPAPPGKMSTRWGGFLEDVAGFDASFFGISPREADGMDPQQRLLLEVAWEALERAGLAPEGLAGSDTGVFVGISSADWARLQSRAVGGPDAYGGTGAALSIAANRLSYLLDLRGPSMAVDTACSSSLVAIHEACQSLRRGECRTALAGGVNLILVPDSTVALSQAGMMAPDGRCKAFDASADGYVRSEGCGVVVLKRLSEARRAGDRVLAVIRGSAVNQDGRSNGLTAPNGPSQQAVVRAALREAGLAPHQLSYVEAHGTGTALGDPIEVDSLKAVLAPGRAPENTCWIGSVKTNIGHLESAAGVAGLIKVVLALRHEEIPANLHLRQLNPHISLAGTPLAISGERQRWPRSAEPRRAGVSSFGFGGTNAHVIVEEAPAEEKRKSIEWDEGKGVLLPVSARSPEALRALTLAYAAHLDGADAGASPVDVAYTAGLRRSHGQYRLAAAGRNLLELAASLRELAERPDLKPARSHGGPLKVAMLFPGHGSQWLGMGRELLAQELVFREAIEAFDAALRKAAGWSLVDELRADAARSRLDEVDVTQCAIVGIQLGLAALWRSWGVEPAVVLGQSLGEVSAACVAGAFSVEDAARLITTRGAMAQRTRGQGAMATVELPSEQVLPYLDARLGIAGINGPNTTVVSGNAQAIQELVAKLNGAGVFSRTVRIAYASHSPQMEPLREPLLEALHGLSGKAARLPIRSTVTNTLLRGEELGPEYWYRNLREPVQLFPAVRALLLEDGVDVLLEVGGHPVLTPALQQIIAHAGSNAVALSSLRREQPERLTLLGTLGSLYSLGQPVPFGALLPAGAKPVELPTYPWQRTRHWLEIAPPGRAGGPGDLAGHPLLGLGLTSSVQQGARFWESEISLEALPSLAEHVLDGRPVLAGAAYLEMAIAAASEAFGRGAVTLEDVSLHEVMELQEATPRTVQLAMTESRPGAAAFRISSRAAGATAWTLHASGTVRVESSVQREPERTDLGAVKARCAEHVTGEAHYTALRARRLRHTSTFASVAEIHRQQGEALARLRAPEGKSFDGQRYRIDPALLDSALQAALATLPGYTAAGEHAPEVPVGWRTVRVHALPDSAAELWSHATLRATDARSGEVEVDLALLDATGGALVELLGLHIKRLGTANAAETVLAIEWQPIPQPEPRADSGNAGGPWILISGDDAASRDVQRELTARGQTVLRIDAARLAAASGPQAVDAIFQEVLGDTASCAGALYLAGTPGTQTPGSAVEAGEPAWACALNLIQALARRRWRAAPRLWLSTRGTQPVDQGPAARALPTSPLWGLGRTLAYEHPELRCTNVDLDVAPHTGEAERLVNALLAAPKEEALALRGEEWHAARLVRRAPSPRATTTAPARGRPFRLDIDTPGSFDRLVLREVERRAPGKGEVEIAVKSAGLNFLDVLVALGVIANDPQSPSTFLGLECAGTVVATGEGVTGLRPGDRVVALTPHAFSSFVTVSEALVARIPGQLSFAQASTLPVAHATAYLALAHRAKLARGERVLIHSAAGAVGMAAVQWAQHVGAEVFATVGTPDKHEHLKALGVRHISDSRSLRFVDDVRAWTGGEGVDVVLNSLSGEAIPRSLELLRDDGRFIEIGKRDYLENAQLGVRPFLKGLSFSLVDLRAMLLKRPEQMGRLLREVMDLVAQGTLKPLPHRTFPISQAADAFRTMGQGKHLGKFVFELEDESAQIAAPRWEGRFRADATYLVTGGLGGLGLRLARWMIEHGARRLVLAGRGGAGPEQQKAIAAMEQAGATVVAARADVSRRTDVERLLETVTASGHPLRGVFHLAAVLDDGMVQQQDRERFRRVLAPKVDGAWNLHQLTQGAPLDFFVLFSSAASLIGSPGQTNYASGNAFLDALAQHRRALGLPALSIGWGPFSEVGLAAAEANRGGRVADRGLANLSPAEGMARLAALLDTGDAHVGVLNLDVRQWMDFYPTLASSALFSRLAQPEARAGTRQAAQREAILAAPPERRRSLMERFVREQISRVLRLDPARLDADAPLKTFGLDSIGGLELRNRLEAGTALSLSPTLIWTYSSVAALSEHLLGLIAPAEAKPEAAPRADATEERLRAEAKAMSDAKLMAELARELEDAEQDG